MEPTKNPTKPIEDALAELATATDEVRLKIHLAGLDAKKTWNESLEPRLEQAWKHAKDAKHSSKAAIEETLEAVRRFAASL